MELILALFLVQGLIGALDNLWHHEITENLTHRPTARGELALHTIREFLYAVIFLGLGWLSWHGAWAILLACLIGIEIIVTLWDFIVEDETRKLPKFERVLHTILAINLGVILAFLVPMLMDWMGQPTSLVPTFYGWLSWAMTVFGVAVFFWALYDLFAVVRLGVPEWHRHPIKAGTHTNPRRVLITGGTGFIGGHLIRTLIKNGDHPVLLTRDPAKADYLFGPHVDVVTTLDEIADQDSIDAVINLAGAPLLGGLWTKARRKTLSQSRLQTTYDVIALIRRLKVRPEVLISGSAIGYYGTDAEKTFTEDDPPLSNFTAQLCAAWESAARQAERYGVRACRMRMGIVLGRTGGAFPQLTLPIKMGAGTILGTGQQWMSWVHVNDLVRMILWAMDDKDVGGAINAVAPEPVTVATFTQNVGKHLKRPIWLRIPKRLVTTCLGEMSEFFVEGQKVYPDAAQRLGFQFHHATLDHALADLLRREETSDHQKTEACGIYFNDECPVCDTEIAHYRKLVAAGGLALTFHEISTGASPLANYRLSTDALKKRLYVMDQNGNLKGGAEAFALIWREIPRYRWAAGLLRVTPIFVLAELVYDGVLAPCLFAWNQWRDDRTTKRFRHG